MKIFIDQMKTFITLKEAFEYFFLNIGGNQNIFLIKKYNKTVSNEKVLKKLLKISVQEQ